MYEESLKKIEQFWLTHGRPATTREMSEMWGLHSTSSTRYRAQRMVQMGLLRHDDGHYVPETLLRQVQLKFAEVRV